MSRGLTHIHVEGFRSLNDVDLEPGPVTVLIGANGSGKSNLIALLKMVALMRTGSLRRFVGESGGASALLHYGPKETPELTLRLEFDDEGATNAYAASLGHAAGDSLRFLGETVEHRPAPTAEPRSFNLGAGHPESSLEKYASDPQQHTARTVRWWLEGMSFFHFHDTSLQSPLRQNARREDARYLRSDGSNLAAYLLNLAQGSSEDDAKAWRRIEGLVQRVAPFIKRLLPTLVDPGHAERSAVRLDWLDERDHLFGSHHLSDGTLRAIALITALAQPKARLPRFITIDEPELGLHPAALTVLVSLVRSVASRCQVLLATQSPALLDHFEPEEVVVAERLDGATRFQRLAPQRLAEWLEEYALSELYEKNLLGGRP